MICSFGANSILCKNCGPVAKKGGKNVSFAGKNVLFYVSAEMLDVT
jgi:hypothetical protein